jgi:DNA adenine methylase
VISRLLAGHAPDVLAGLESSVRLGVADAPPVTRTALRFYGGKASLAPWIVAQLPDHESYVEPYGGACSVLLHKRRSVRETYNDLDGAVVSFFRCLRDCPDALIRAIRLTPFARAEVEAADVDAPALDDLERARRLYVRSWQTIHGAPSRGRLGWRCEKAHTGGGTSADAWVKTEHLYAIAARLQGVQIECREALEVIERFDHAGALHFVDPPYVSETRGRRWALRGYAHEVDEAHHRALAALLHEVAGLVVLCGYHSALYDELYADWPRREHLARQQSRAVTTECLWLSPRAWVASKRRDLFSVLDEQEGAADAAD